MQDYVRNNVRGYECQNNNFQHFTHRKGDLYHQATLHVCLLMSCHVISSFKLLLTTAFIITRIGPVINTYYL